MEQGAKMSVWKSDKGFSERKLVRFSYSKNEMVFECADVKMIVNSRFSSHISSFLVSAMGSHEDVSVGVNIDDVGCLEVSVEVSGLISYFETANKVESFNCFSV